MAKNDITEYTDDEIRTFARNGGLEAAQIKSVLKQIIINRASGIQRFEAYLSDLTQQSTALLTVAGLFTLLPSLNNPESIKYFLIWVFPFIFFSIFCFLISSSRAKSYVHDGLIAPEGTEDELVMMKLEVKAIRIVYSKMFEVYMKSLNWYRIMTIFLRIYFLSFIVTYYQLYFFQLFDFRDSIIVISLLSLISILIYLNTKFNSSMINLEI